MNRFFGLVLVLISISFTQAQMISFYSDTLSFKISCNPVPLFSGKTDEKKDILAYYESLQGCGILKELSSQLEGYKKEYRLNDFYMTQLLEKYSIILVSKISDKQQKVLMYCVLRYMGYDAQLAYAGSKYMVLALSDTELYNHPYLKVKNRKYSSVHKSVHKGAFSQSIDYVNSVADKTFAFSITEVPSLKNIQYQNKKIPFYKTNHIYYDDKSESVLRGKIKEIRIDTSYLEFVFNKSLIDLYDDLPINENSKYFFLGLSKHLRKQVFSYLKLTGLATKQDTLRHLISFARSIGEYKTDMEAYKRERPMFPEEALYYQYTDCEDRNALLFYLIKEVLNQPMIILEYPDHINIGVSIKGKYKQSVKYQGNVFYVCEASSGGSKVEIGESYAFDKYNHPKIIGEYNP
jgi:hypothetical protein